MTESTAATYVYCVVDSAAKVSGARAPAGIPGGDRPRPLALGGTLWLVASDAPSVLYDEDALRANLQRLEWVSEVAVAHEAVVEHFTRTRGATVIPMKLLTLFSSEEKAKEALRKRRTEIRAAIRRISGCEEWGVRIFAAATPGAARDPGKPAARSESMSGTAFLTGRKAVREAGQAARARAVSAAEDAYHALTAFARASRQRPRTAEPGTNPPLLDAAFLVTAGSRARFRSAVRRHATACAAAGAQLTLTGPWPAYNFVGDTGETT